MFNQLLLNGIIAGSIYALIGLGFTVIYRTVKFFHFAYGVVYTAGAYFAYTFAISLGFHFLPSFLATVFATLLGLCIDRFVYYPLRQREASNLVYLIASFIGAAVLVILLELLRFLEIPSAIAAPLRQMTYGLLLILLMLKRPQGLVGRYQFR